MKGLRKLRKRNILLLALLALLLLTAVSSVLAFTTRTTRVTNVVSYGSVKLEIIENTLSNGLEVPYTQTGAVPIEADEYSRIVRLKNIGKHPIYVRVALSLTAVDSGGSAVTVPADCYSFDIDKTAWAEQDGWYYYDCPALAHNEETTDLMTKIMFDHIKLTDLSGCQLTLNIQAEAVQSENNGDRVWNAQGWPSDEGGGAP